MYTQLRAVSSNYHSLLFHLELRDVALKKSKFWPSIKTRRRLNPRGFIRSNFALCFARRLHPHFLDNERSMLGNLGCCCHSNRWLSRWEGGKWNLIAPDLTITLYFMQFIKVIKIGPALSLGAFEKSADFESVAKLSERPKNRLIYRASSLPFTTVHLYAARPRRPTLWLWWP